MNTNRRFVAGLMLLLVAMTAWPVNAGADPLQYVFKVGQNLVYEVKIRTEYPDHVDTQSAYLMYEPKALNNGKGQAKLSYYWEVYWNQTQTDTGSRGGGGGLPFFLRKQKGDLGKGSDFTVNRQGQIIDIEGLKNESQLPHALGSAYLLLMLPLPTGDQKSWQTHRDLTLASYHSQQEPSNGPWAGKNSTTTTETAATETVTYTLGDTNDGILTINRKYDVESQQKVGDVAALSITGDGDYQFNPKTGDIENYQMKLSQNITTANASIKIPITVEARLLTADEVKKLQDDQETADTNHNQQHEKDSAKAREDARNDLSGLPDGMAKSELLGATDGGGPFTTVNADHLPVIGFRVRTDDWFGHKRFRTFEPLFEKPTDHKDGETVVMARDGYAVGALTVDATDSIYSISITFMKKTDAGLDPKSAYSSPLYGKTQNPKRTVLTGDGKFIYGIYGRKGLNVDAIGLVTEANPDTPATQP